MLRKIITLILTLACLCSLPCFAQNKKDRLEKEKAALQKEINVLSSSVKAVEKSTKDKTVQLQGLKNKQQVRQKLIKNISSQLNSLNQEISVKQGELKKLESELENLKKEYAKMCAYYYSNKQSYNNLMYIFASESFEQAYKRRKYIAEYAQNIRKTGEELKARSLDIKARIARLQDLSDEQSSLLGEQSNQLAELAKEQKQEQTLLTELQGRKKKLQQELNKRINSQRKIETEIRKIIAAELAARKKAAEKSGSKLRLDNMTPEAKALSNNFALNKGKLPWPVAKGIIYSRFGRQPYPGLPNVTVNNIDIELSSPVGEKARAVFGGEVISIQLIASNYAVIVQHGRYFTVYNGLSKVYVKQGAKLSTKQEIGAVYTDPEDKKTNLKFSLFDGETAQNPELWLSKM